jgi:hypothetical protein
MEKKRIKAHFKDDKEIPLILNSYDDIFSDLDPRDYLKRALSGDFLLECKKASSDKKNKISIKLFIPKDKRDLEKEKKIKKRLKDHFDKHFNEKKKELKKLNRVGLSWFFLGCFLIILTSIQDFSKGSFIIKVLINISHPAGWFFLWEGMGKILLTSKERKSDFIFYKKMIESNVEFFDY